MTWLAVTWSYSATRLKMKGVKAERISSGFKGSTKQWKTSPASTSLHPFYSGFISDTMPELYLNPFFWNHKSKQMVSPQWLQLTAALFSLHSHSVITIRLQSKRAARSGEYLTLFANPDVVSVTLCRTHTHTHTEVCSVLALFHQ